MYCNRVCSFELLPLVRAVVVTVVGVGLVVTGMFSVAGGKIRCMNWIIYCLQSGRPVPDEYGEVGLIHTFTTLIHGTVAQYIGGQWGRNSSPFWSFGKNAHFIFKG